MKDYSRRPMKKGRAILDAEEFVATFALYEDLRNKSFLITGASGLIGRTLVRCLSRLNDVYNLNTVLYAPRHTELEDWIASYDGRVDYIIHLACPTASHEMLTHPVEVCNAIIEPTRHLLDFALQQQAMMVYASSMEVYGAVANDDEITEEYQGYIDPLSARSSYPMGKRMAETLCYCYAQEYGVDVRIARLAQTFGAGIAAEEQRVFAQFARSVIAGRDIILHTAGRSARKYLYLTDAIQALLYILIKGEKGQAYNVAHPQSYISVLEMAKLLQQDFAPQINVRVEMIENSPYPCESHLNLSTTKLETLGWQARVPLTEMFARLIESLRE